MPLEALPYVTLLGIFFGTTLVASRFSVGQFHPTTYVGLRLTLASLGHLGAFLVLQTWPRSRRLWLHAAVLGLVGTAIPMTGIVLALQHQSSGLTAMFISLAPVITVVLAHFLLPEEPLTRRKMIGVVLAFSGALLLVARGESGLPAVRQVNRLGVVLVMVSLLFGSVADIYARRYMRDLRPLDVAGIRMFVAALIVMPLSVLLAGFDLQRVDARGYLALGYASVAGAFLPFLLAFYIVKRFGATAAAMPTYLTPIVATLVGALLLGEAITVGMAASMVIIIVGVGVVNYGRRQTRAPENISGSL